MYWNLYFKHVRPSGLKYTLLLAVLQLFTSFLASHYITRIFVDDDMQIIYWAFVASVLKPIVHKTWEVILNQASTNEAISIANAISVDIQHAFLSARREIASEIPQSSITTACTEAFYAYYNTTWQIIRMFPELVDFMVVVYIATDKSWMMTQVFLFGSSIILLVQKMMDDKMEKLSKEMIVQTNLTRLYISRLWTNLFVWLQTPYGAKPPVPAEFISLGISMWFDKDKKTKISHLITDIMQGFFSLTCLLFVSNKFILIWLIINNQRLWKGVGLWRRLTEIVIHNQAKMTPHLVNFEKCQKSSKIEVPLIDKKGDIILNSIEVIQPNCPQVKLESSVDIRPNARIVIEGQKGSGKTYLISILTRLVDVNADMFLGRIKIEPSQLRIFIVFQTIASLFTENHKKTISHSLEELFPSATMENLVIFLKMFDLEGIIQKGENPLKMPLGKNETTLSPGTVRTIVLAHRMWILQQDLESGDTIHALVLDEADTAIDFGTIQKVYTEYIDPLLQKYHLPCIIVSHSKEFRDLVRDIAIVDCHKVLTARKNGDVITYQ